ncbi:MAG: T9SS type A sorting domain-containing protein [Bacteroidota bacterium]
MAVGNYTLIAKSGSASGVTGTPGTLTISGSGLAANTYGSLSVSSGELILTVDNATPAISSPTATSITQNSATLGANITSDRGLSISARGTVFKTSSPVTSSDNTLAEGGTSTGTFLHSRTGLTEQTLYYYAGFATNSVGTALSSEGSFRTLSASPTAQASSLTATPASSTQVDLSFTGATFPGSGATQAGYVVIYSTGTPTLSSTNGQAPAAGVGTIFTTSATALPTTPSTSVNVTGLSSSTTYNFLVVPYTWDGTNSTTYNYLTTSAPTANATTSGGVPTLSIPTASAITATSATLGATVTSDGGSALTARGTVFKTSTPVASSDNALAEGGSSVAAFTHSRTGLTEQTLYYYAGYATNITGTGLSSEGSFTTLSAAPIGQAASLSTSGATTTTLDLTIGSAATFPASGATNAGYVVIYSTGTPTLSSINGQAPAAGVGTIFNTASTSLPSAPSTTITITGLSASTTYNILVVPYTWDGTNIATYNYLTASAPTTSGTTSLPTYTWTGANNASWSTASNWSPNRTSPASNDILIFNSNTTLTVTGVPTQTIGTLQVSGSSTKITLQASAASTTLSIGNNTGTDLSVSAGCELNISGSNSLSLVTSAGATGSIDGSMKFTQAAHTLIPNDASAVTFNNGASFTAGDLASTGFTGNAFGPSTGTTYNGVVFASGATFTQNEGSNPFAITQPNSRVQFQTGSNFIFALAGTGVPSLVGRTYGNVEINCTSTGLTNLTGSSVVTINGNLTITAAGSAVNFNHTGGISIAGNISVASGQTLGFSPSSANTLTLNGSSSQTISGSGTLTIGSNISLIINNNNGVSLSRNLTLPNTLTLTSGTLTVGANTLTLNGSISRTSGNIDASNASATVTFSGSSAQSIPASTFTGNINNLTLNNSAGLSTSQSLTVANTLTLTSGTFTVGANTLTLNGSITRTSGNINANNVSATLEFSGLLAQSIPAATFTGNINTLILNNSAGLSTSQNLTVTNSLTLTSGTFTVGSTTFTINGSISRTLGNIDASNASATVTFSGSSAQSIPASTFTGNINNLTLNNSAGLSSSQNLTVASVLTLTSGNLSLGSTTLTLNGTYPSNINNITTSSSSGLVLNCTGIGPFTLPAFTALNDLTINTSGQSYNLNSSLVLSGILTLNSGTLVVGNNTLNINGSISRTLGNIDASNASATVTFSGSSAQSIPASTFTGNINTLILNNSAGLSTSQNLTISNALNLTSGTFTVGSTTLTLNGSITRTSGNIDASNGSATVIFSGSSAQSIPPSTFTGNINHFTLNNSANLSINESLSLAGTLTLTSGALNIGAHTLTLNGSVARTSGAIRSAGGSISIGGSSGNLSLHMDQTTAGTTNRLTNLTVNRASTTITLGNPMQLTGTLTVTSGTLASAGNLTLVSNASGTARVAELVSGASVTGNVTAEIHIPSVARRWRFLTPTVSGSTFNDWKNEIYLVGPGGSSNGFDASGTGSVFSYNEPATGSSSIGWTSLTSTSTTVVPGAGYRTFIYGDRSNPSVITNSSLPQSAVTVNTNGPLNTGDISLPVTYTANVSVNHDGWNLVGNPYHSPYDWNSYYDNCTTGCYNNIEPTIWVFDASTNNYKSYNATSGGTLTDGIIPTGAAFWVKANAATPSVTLKETYKTAAAHNQVFKNGNNELKLEMRLDATNADYFVLKHIDSASVNADKYDIAKMNGSVNIMSYTSTNQSFMFDCRPALSANDTVLLFVNGSNGSYSLKVNELPSNGKYYYLVDRKMSSTTLLAPLALYTFSITNSDTTTFGRRFYIVVSNSGTLPVEWKSFSARRQSSATHVHWSTATELNASHYEVQRSSDNINFRVLGKMNARNTNGNSYEFFDNDPLRGIHYYRILQVDFDQTETYTHVVAVNCDEASDNPLVKSAWPTVVTSDFHVVLDNDSYNIQVYDINGRVIWNHALTGERIDINTTGYGAGMYFMHIVSRTTGKSETLKFIKKE